VETVQSKIPVVPEKPDAVKTIGIPTQERSTSDVSSCADAETVNIVNTGIKAKQRDLLNIVMSRTPLILPYM
jgi:hypothetical protein